jgi:hypothetical protein
LELKTNGYAPNKLGGEEIPIWKRPVKEISDTIVFSILMYIFHG